MEIILSNTGYQLLRFWSRLLLRVLFSFKVSGLENIPSKKSFIFIANHSSVIDGISVASAYPGKIYFLAVDSLFTSIWGWWVRKLINLPVRKERFNREAIREAVVILKGGGCLGIFPEGKISVDGQLDKGKAGIVLIARLANADIIPCSIEGAYEAWPVTKKLPRRFPVEVRFGKPIDISNYPSSNYPMPEQMVKEMMEEIA